jgi:ATP-dependent helicase/nuclease subunit A
LPGGKFLLEVQAVTTALLSQFSFKGRQEEAATDPHAAIAVTAGAGSGKTLSLVGRYLHLLERGYPLRSILAITFTEKAAREMRSRIRIRAALASVATASAQFQLSGIDAARIGTIHSLCAEILRAYPAEVGIDPAFSVLEEGLAAAWQAEAIEAALAWAANDVQSAALFGVFKESELRQALKTLMVRRLELPNLHSIDTGNKDPGEKRGVPIGGPSFSGIFGSALQHYLQEILDSRDWLAALDDLTTCYASSPDDKLELARQSALAHWAEIRSACASQSWDAALSSLAALRKSLDPRGGRKDGWGEVELATVRAAMGTLKDIYEEQLKFLAEKSRFALDEQVAACLPAVQSLLERALSEYWRRKNEHQALDFDDLEGRTARLLGQNAAVRAALQSELSAVLVDEFQDTNERQRQIVYALAGFSSTTNASPAREGRNESQVDLFIVGDAKQSIYKFRGADVSVFRRVQADIEAAGGLRLDLDLTFRAHKALLDNLNTLLAPILGETDDPARPYLVPFAPLRAYRQTPAEGTIRPPFVEFHLGLGENADQGRLAAATALCQRLRRLHEGEGFAWGDMVLLFRASSAFTAYENALEAGGIPFITVAGRGFYERPEIRDLLNALAAIADPNDNLALVGLLRSPGFAIPDGEIYQLRIHTVGQDGAERPIKRNVLDALRASMIPAHQRAYAILNELHGLAGRAPAAAVLKRLLDLTSYRAILASVPGGTRMIRNVEKLLADAHRSRMVSLPSFLTYVRTLRDVGRREGEAPVDTAISGAVQLMTIHKAKGLEFPLVVLADAAYTSHAYTPGVQITPETILLDLRDGDFRPTAWQLAARLEEARDDAENRRLLYVASTRAREKLLINAHVKLKKDGSLMLAGWLNHFGLDKIKISAELSTPETFRLSETGLAVTLYPASPAEKASLQPESPSKPTPPQKSELVEPLPLTPAYTDERTQTRESDPPQRVWRVVPTAKRPAVPAWVVGKLVHEALRRWRFPDANFEDYLHPFALEAGFTDWREIHAAILESRRLLERLRNHPIYNEINSAERRHEFPYFLPEERGVIDLLYHTESEWFIVDFKTDELRSEGQARLASREKGYDQQLRRYVHAVAEQLSVLARPRLIFLNVDNRLVIFDLPMPPTSA